MELVLRDNFSHRDYRGKLLHSPPCRLRCSSAVNVEGVAEKRKTINVRIRRVVALHCRAIPMTYSKLLQTILQPPMALWLRRPSVLVCYAFGSVNLRYNASKGVTMLLHGQCSGWATIFLWTIVFNKRFIIGIDLRKCENMWSLARMIYGFGRIIVDWVRCIFKRFI